MPTVGRKCSWYGRALPSVVRTVTNIERMAKSVKAWLRKEWRKSRQADKAWSLFPSRALRLVIGDSLLSALFQRALEADIA